MKVIDDERLLIPKKNRVAFSILITVLMAVILVFVAYEIFNNKLDHLLDTENGVYLDEITSRGIDSVNREVMGDIQLLNELAFIMGTTNNFKIDAWIPKLREKGLLEEFDEVGVILPNGQTYGAHIISIDYSKSDEFQRAMRGEIVVSRVVIERVGYNRVIKYLVPVERNGKVIAVLGAVFHTEVFQKTLDLPSFHGKGSTYIVDSKGSIIVHSEGQAQFGNIFDGMEKPNKGINTMRENLKTGNAGSLYFSKDGVPQQLVYKPIGINDWSFLTVIPDDLTVYKERTIRALALILSGLVALILTAFVGYILVEQNKHRKSLLHLAYIDEVTGIYNKHGFKQQAEQLLKNSKVDYAFVLLDISKFKIINDIFGYDQGDLFLRHMAKMLSDNIGEKEIFARIDGDKFYVLIEYVTLADVAARVQKIMDDITAFQFASNSVYRTVVCAGIYIIEDIDMSIDSMSDRANLANRKIKDSHDSAYFIYNDEIRHRLLDDQEIENEMQQALDNQEFKVYLQPKYDVKTEKIAGAEALIRWQHPTKGLISPNRFIPVFEKDGFVTKVDMFVLEEVCRRQKEWQEQGYTPRIISINQSKLHLYNPYYVEDLMSITNKYQVDPNYIEFEITESAVLDSADILLDVTSRIRQAGYKISIDDFGTGYSSLNMLKDLTLDTLKLDGQFFSETINLKRSHKITENIIRMSKDLGMKVVAEGVETKEQVDYLRTIGCDLIQGYYYAKPMPMDDFYQLLLEEETLVVE